MVSIEVNMASSSLKVSSSIMDLATFTSLWSFSRWPPVESREDAFEKALVSWAMFAAEPRFCGTLGGEGCGAVPGGPFGGTAPGSRRFKAMLGTWFWKLSREAGSGGLDALDVVTVL